jgi:hypothetical protein
LGEPVENTSRLGRCDRSGTPYQHMTGRVLHGGYPLAHGGRSQTEFTGCPLKRPALAHSGEGLELRSTEHEDQLNLHGIILRKLAIS